jgi:hypothetical protein
MFHEEVFGRIGADHRFGDGDESYLLALEDRPGGRGLDRVAKESVELMDGRMWMCKDTWRNLVAPEIQAALLREFLKLMAPTVDQLCRRLRCAVN